ncbi:hypothetical protein F0L74_26400 [Chitinophaga agrisoli]|uniref:Uncharacterized protein n=1 Tax=Chitinophaga agrisoli TaxID=2607653 RepID=A0A5B2VMT5_9BACT|nr:hypothetical protein [Chitinophaga agrisoli]KAA2239726.1 hypothetical protein F0L74_26400 [Chitinophaga agrisoli]
MKQRRNTIMRGASGAFGDELVFRQRAGETVIAKPSILGPDSPTEKQVAVRTRFRAAAAYAKAILADPAMKAAYQAKTRRGASPYNTAIQDYFQPPEIRFIDNTAYSGAIGTAIKVIATDDFRVNAVTVAIHNAAGAVLEEGPAIADPAGGDTWTYVATIENAAPAGGKVVVQAKDLPGNTTTEELAL